ncbi:hypothetical protein G9A89_001552 [Geosiphon pyriformis]|nr:hypothetical protein G9A89_001552 [Geosiphon pyriformis]
MRTLQLLRLSSLSGKRVLGAAFALRNLETKAQSTVSASIKTPQLATTIKNSQGLHKDDRSQGAANPKKEENIKTSENTTPKKKKSSKAGSKWRYWLKSRKPVTQKKFETNLKSSIDSTNKSVSIASLVGELAFFESTRTDNIIPPPKNIVALDCENVDIKKDGKQKKLARLSIVDFHGNVLIDKYFETSIRHFKTTSTGITPEKLENVEEEASVKIEAAKLLHGKIIVGHNVNFGLGVLGWCRPEYQLRDIEKYQKFKSLNPEKSHQSLKDLAKIFFGKNIQVKHNDSLENAMTSLEIYKKHQKEWEEDVLNHIIKKVGVTLLKIESIKAKFLEGYQGSKEHQKGIITEAAQLAADSKEETKDATALAGDTNVQQSEASQLTANSVVTRESAELSKESETNTIAAGSTYFPQEAAEPAIIEANSDQIEPKTVNPSLLSARNFRFVQRFTMKSRLDQISPYADLFNWKISYVPAKENGLVVISIMNKPKKNQIAKAVVEITRKRNNLELNINSTNQPAKLYRNENLAQVTTIKTASPKIIRPSLKKIVQVAINTAKISNTSKQPPPKIMPNIFKTRDTISKATNLGSISSTSKHKSQNAIEKGINIKYSIFRPSIKPHTFEPKKVKIPSTAKQKAFLVPQSVKKSDSKIKTARKQIKYLEGQIAAFTSQFKLEQNFQDLWTRVERIPSNYLALDCEMVGVGRNGIRSELARISIVDFDGNMVMDKFVKPKYTVTDYRTEYSGVTEELLETAENFDQVRHQVLNLFQDKIVVGHSLENDFQVLKYYHPAILRRDTTLFQKFNVNLPKGATPSLKSLAETILKKKIQVGSHDSVQDAQAALELYRMHRREWEETFLASFKQRMQLLQNNNRRKLAILQELKAPQSPMPICATPIPSTEKSVTFPLED